MCSKLVVHASYGLFDCIETLVQQLEELKRACTQLQEECRLKDEQCKGMATDLANMTKENQVGQ